MGFQVLTSFLSAGSQWTGPSHTISSDVFCYSLNLISLGGDGRTDGLSGLVFHQGLCKITHFATDVSMDGLGTASQP